MSANVNGNSPEKLTLNVAEVAVRLGISEDLTRFAIDQAEDPIPSFRVGRRILVSRALLEEWIIRRSGGHVGDNAPGVVTSLSREQ